MSCNHPDTDKCRACGGCISCDKALEKGLEAAKAEVNSLGVALARSSSREEQLRSVLTQGAHNPVERDERNLAIARIAILRKRIESLIKPKDSKLIGVYYEDKGWEEQLQTILDSDALIRTRDPAEVFAEAVKP